MTRTKDSKAVYVLFEDEGKSAEFSLPGCKVVSNKGFSEEEMASLADYVRNEQDSIFETAKKINPMKAFLGNGFSLIELIIVIAIMAILVGVLSPMFVKYVDRSKKARDVYTADQIARAVNVAFVENPEAYNAFSNWKTAYCTVSVMENGEAKSYGVYRVASNGVQGTNSNSNCFNGGMDTLYKNPDGSNDRGKGATGFYGVINRELGLSTTEMNYEIIPKFSKNNRVGAGVDRGGGVMEPYAELDRWRIVRRADNGMMEIWAAQPNPGGGYPIYRVWPEPDDLYRE